MMLRVSRPYPSLCLLLQAAPWGRTTSARWSRAGPVPRRARGARPAASLADTKWFDLFQDETLKQMVTTALEHNFDLRIASERVQQARAQFGITRAESVPVPERAGAFHRAAAVVDRVLPVYHAGTNLERQLHAGGRGAVLGAGHLGPVAPADRIRTRTVSGQRRRPPRRDRLAGRRRDDELLHLARAGPGTRDREPDTRHRPGQSPARRSPAQAGRGHRPRCPPGGAVPLHGDSPDRGHSARDRADRECAQPAASAACRATSSAERSSRNSPCPPILRPDCLPPCSSAGRTSGRRSRI